ncbi:MAG: hypothetical protein GC161_15010 [Planctomycetaceae bacterium]|nr:hypothetical protein [Planctomycetaceae bacterium]
MFSSALLLLCGSTLIGDPLPPPQDTIAVPAVISQSFALGHRDGALHADGANYFGRFDGTGMAFVPALGPAADHNQPLHLAVQAVARGGVTVLDHPLVAEPEARGSGAEVERWTGIQERWQISGAGVELSYRFERPIRGEGDLQVVVAVATELSPRVDAGGLYFDHRDASGRAAGGVHVGAVTGVDAVGRTAAGALHFAEGRLVLSLPGEFVDNAQYPLVLDPLVGVVLPLETNPLTDDRSVAAASDGDNYLVVWRRFTSSTDADILGHRVSGSGSLLGSLLSISTGTGNYSAPSVGYNRFRDVYLVAYQWSTGTTIGQSDIRARGVVAPLGALGTQFTIAATTDFDVQPRVTSDTGGSDNGLLVLYNQSPTGLRLVEVGLTTGGNLQALGASPFIPGTDSQSGNGDISRSGGVNGRWLVTWTQVAAGVTQLRGRVYTAAATAWTGMVDLVTSTTDILATRNDGDGVHWLVVYERRENTGTDRDIFAQVVTLSGSGLGSYGSAVGVEFDSNDNETDPSVAFLGSSFLVAWRDEDGAPNTDIGYKLLDSYTADTIENEATLDGGAQSLEDPAVVSLFSGSAPNSAPSDAPALIGWPVISSGGTGTGNISVQRFLSSAGNVTVLGGGCLGGTAATGTPAVGNGDFTLHYHTPLFVNGSTVFLLVGATQTAIPCGTCVIGVDPFNSMVLPVAVGALGNASVAVPIPNDNALVGAEFFVQWANASLLATSCPTYGVNFSDLLEVRIQ